MKWRYFKMACDAEDELDFIIKKVGL